MKRAARMMVADTTEVIWDSLSAAALALGGTRTGIGRKLFAACWHADAFGNAAARALCDHPGKGPVMMGCCYECATEERQRMADDGARVAPRRRG